MVIIPILLFGFFIGNIISVGFATILINKFKNYKLFLLFNMLIFVLIMPVFIFISDKYVFFYACILGLLGGGLPTVWVQLVVKSYGTNLRATATASLTAFGRMTCIIFNLLFQSWLTNPNIFIKNAIIMICLLTMIVCLVIYYTKNNYNKELNFIEN